LSFKAIAVGDIVLSMADTSNIFAGGAFTSATTFGPQVVDFGTADVSVSVSNVPVPATVWLFGSGLLGLVGVARKHKTT